MATIEVERIEQALRAALKFVPDGETVTRAKLDMALADVGRLREMKLLSDAQVGWLVDLGSRKVEQDADRRNQSVRQAFMEGNAVGAAFHQGFQDGSRHAARAFRMTLATERTLAMEQEGK